MDNILENLPRLFSEAFIKSVKQNFQIDEASILNGTSTIIGRIVLSGVNNFIPSVIGIVLESFTKANDSELKKMSKLLSKISREPFLTGIDQLKAALNISPSNDQENYFQQQRLMAALQNFDKAIQLCEEDEKVQIKFLQASTLLKINGGAKEAKSKLGEFIEIVKTRKIQLENNYQNLQQSASIKKQEAKSIIAVSPKGGGGLIGFSGSSEYFKKMELLSAVNKIEVQCEKILEEVKNLNKIVATTSITYNLLD